ncbi:uncharacterized protein LOC113044524 isoform X1 [Carassius auratus]|uniref:Uncharacterized protein LOC113044524 isoform X1 n=1 Tax=Carassius auratus TaxID=7957 RepID=A0A6P6JM26_CARAU|nr:uncharacterized protein LOC113044524 isoform X1 [Carassius auratus]
MAEMKREHPSSVGSKKPIPQTFEEAIVSGFHQSQHSRNALLAMLNDIPPAIQSRISMSSLCLDILSLLLELISPKLKPVNPQLYSTREKQQLYDLIDTMINFNLTYRQDRTVEGQYTCSGAVSTCTYTNNFTLIYRHIVLLALKLCISDFITRIHNNTHRDSASVYVFITIYERLSCISRLLSLPPLLFPIFIILRPLFHFGDSLR